MTIETELERQVAVLVGLGYPRLAGLTEESLRVAATSLAQPLAAYVDHADAQVEVSPGRATFVLVPGRSLVPPSKRVPLLSLGDRQGTLSRHFADVDFFQPVVDVPDVPLYAVAGVDRGDEFLGVRPSEAATVIAARGRTMLTVEEGIAFLHACPEALERNRCFHTGASRGADRRVPALWIADRAPHLGWCWENNHHTWLGVASAETRITPEA